MADRIWLAVATLLYCAASAMVVLRLGARVFKPSPGQFGLFVAALAAHTWFLIERGQVTRHCPISSLFDVLVFVLWSVAIVYVVIGPLYRLSLLGVFTAPVVFLGLVLVQILPVPSEPNNRPTDYWIELHASLSILAYGALGISGLTGVVYMVQDYCLKNKKMLFALGDLPSLNELARVNRHILLYGLTLLTAGLVTGLFLPATNHGKLMAFGLIWLFYAALFVGSVTHQISERRVALLSLATYTLMISTFWSINKIASGPS